MKQLQWKLHTSCAFKLVTHVNDSSHICSALFHLTTSTCTQYTQRHTRHAFNTRVVGAPTRFCASIEPETDTWMQQSMHPYRSYGLLYPNSTHNTMPYTMANYSKIIICSIQSVHLFSQQNLQDQHGVHLSRQYLCT